jgi:cytochrome c biogenesis protein ResB
MFVAMIVGSIFPQGYDPEMYISSWGEAKYESIARWGVLNLFHSKFFLTLGIVLLLNLVVCSLVRWFGRSGARLAGERPPAYAREVKLEGGHGMSPSVKAVSVLESRGYKVLSSTGNVVTARRGPWPEGVSLLYHIAMAVAIIGFIVSALFAFEGDVTLYPDEPQQVATVSDETGAIRLGLVKPDTTAWADRYVTLNLNEFITEWEYYEEKYYPRDWFSDLTVEDDNGRSRDFMIEVNRPLRVSGLTFYQMAYDQTFDVVVMQDTLEVERVSGSAYVPFTLESIGGMFFPGTMRVGTLYQKYHDTEPVVPHTPLKWQPPAEGEPGEDATDVGEMAHGEAEEPEGEHGEGSEHAEEAAHDEEGEELEEEPPPPPPEKLEIGDLSAEVPLEVEGYEGYTLILENPYEGSVLTYRHDPGVPLLYLSIIAFMVGLAIRTYWPSYRVNLWIEDGADGRKGWLAFRAAGMLGEPELIEEDLVKALAEPEL